MVSNLLASILDATTDDVSELAIEYGQLISLTQLTDVQGDRVQELLDRACNDGALSFWISELDHVIAHETELLTSDCRYDYDNKKALLKEDFMELFQAGAADKSPREIRELLGRYLAAKNNSRSVDPLSSQERPNSGDYSHYHQKSTISNRLDSLESWPEKFFWEGYSPSE